MLRSSARARLERHDGYVTKTASRQQTDHEAMFYALAAPFAPQVLWRTGTTLALQECPTAVELGAEAWHPYRALRALLETLHRWNIHHRDVHARNVVRLPSGAPGLIDWETAVLWPDWGDQIPSYDLEGPSEQLPPPPIHRGRYVMHWNAPHPMAMARFWAGFEEC